MSVEDRRNHHAILLCELSSLEDCGMSTEEVIAVPSRQKLPWMKNLDLFDYV